MKISMILARSVDSVIGVNNDLPWQCPADLKNFKEITSRPGVAVAMGRNTWESLPFKPLKDRLNIVITSKPELIHCSRPRATLTVDSIEAAIRDSKALSVTELIFIGGKGIYDEVIDIVDEVHLTEMNLMVGDVEGTKTIFDYDFVSNPWDKTGAVKWSVLGSWFLLDGETGKETFEYFHLKRK